MTSVTVVVPMTVRRRGGRKQIIGPDGVPMRVSGDGVEETRGDPVLVKALARAFRWRRLLEEGRYGSIRELAKAEGVDRNYVGRLLNLTLLAPEVVEAVVEGQSSQTLGLNDLLERGEAGWAVQRSLVAASAPRYLSRLRAPGCDRDAVQQANPHDKPPMRRQDQPD
jgi:hypothetical protein